MINLTKNYEIPNFKYLTPYNIRLANKVIEENKYCKMSKGEYDYTDKLEKAISSLKNLEDISIVLLRALIHNLEKDSIKIQQVKILKEYRRRLIRHKKTLRRRDIRPLLFYIYDEKNCAKKVFKELKIISQNLEVVKKYNIVKTIVNKSNNLDAMKEEILKILENKSSNEIENYLERLLLQKSFKIYDEILMRNVFRGFLNNKFTNEMSQEYNLLDYKLKKKLYILVLEYILDNSINNELMDHWIKEILDVLGEPYDPSNNKWSGISENLKELVRMWNTKHKLNRYFNEVYTGDIRRRNFWWNYRKSIYRIEFFERYAKALIMEFKNHLIIEFGESGNACYVYELKDKNMNGVISFLDIPEYSDVSYKGKGKGKVIKFFKNKEKCDFKFDHHGAWEKRLKKDLFYRNYRRK